ncbi:MAG: DUF4126 domain-containing protein [Sphaerospermopsis kisseleviana]|jgi:hypothetical protein|uniref:DUF4126 domain-containing protein n=1 Tax=Sphaerospermopsis aphanizomenoides LEGE 00250 TaxID=2777972 RepID=A0ABR9VGJ6_9CYAN|nr:MULTISPECIES: DUF4126 domain-containing protein [Sphaerospermopsis]MBC5795837.1 DUF4126 domain-containing protein [Sphaerospermopsis sp. LEGE 00249]MBE9237618.1 DUF4126 domain-containing protein [Sphaerospermopsis aphanizomenoides LEGE 00250]
MIEILATLSAGAAAGLRLAIPLLIIGLLQGSNLWSEIPILSRISPYVLIFVLTSWSLFEIFASKQLRGQRILQLVELFLSPIVGAIMGLAVASATELPSWLIALVGGLLALVLQLVQLGWFYRLRGLPLWAVFLQDSLCIVLVIFAVDAPQQGGLIALILLWFAVRSAAQWYHWYWENRKNRE